MGFDFFRGIVCTLGTFFVFIYPLASAMCDAKPYKLTAKFYIEITINSTLFKIITIKGTYEPRETQKILIMGICSYISLIVCSFAGFSLNSRLIIIFTTVLYFTFLIVQLLDEIIGLNICRKKWVNQWNEKKPCHRCAKHCFSTDYTNMILKKRIRKEKLRCRRKKKRKKRW